MSQGQDPTPVDAAASAPATRPTHLQAIGLIIAITVIVIAYFAIMKLGFGVTAIWSGILFNIYWTSFEHRSYKRFPASLIGALVGLGMAYMFVALPPVIGLAAGGGVTLAVIVVAVYCLLMSWLPLFVNMSAMLFLTVAGAPPVLHHADFPGAFLALIIGAFFVLLVFKVADWLLERFGNKASAANDKS